MLRKFGLPALVAVPTLIVAFYYALWASDVYVSESRFVVRSPERAATTSLGNLLQGVGFSKAQDDDFTVREYVMSRDALRGLNEKLKLKAAYSSKSVDIFSRFGALDGDDSFEALHRYYQNKVNVSSDSSSSVVTLTVKAFTPEDAANANRMLLEQSEQLVNQLNVRGREDLVRYAQSEVALAETKARNAAKALSQYRNAQGIHDPERQASVQLLEVAKMQEELIATSMQLAQLEKFTPSNPQIPVLRTRTQTLQGEIEKERSRVTGAKSSLANKAAQFQQLALEAEFANKQLASAYASLEAARNEAQRKQVYIERIAQPSVPDYAQEPRRLRSVLGTVIMGLVAWGILSMLLAGLREHQD